MYGREGMMGSNSHCDEQGEKGAVPRTDKNKERAPMRVLSPAFAVLLTVYSGLAQLVA